MKEERKSITEEDTQDSAAIEAEKNDPAATIKE